MASQSQSNEFQQLVEQRSSSLNEPVPSTVACTDAPSSNSPPSSNTKTSDLRIFLTADRAGSITASSDTKMSEFIHRTHSSTDFTSSSMFGHGYNESQETIQTITDDCTSPRDNSYSSLSPINDQQARRNKSYQSFRAPNPPVVYHIQHIANIGHIMTQCPTDKGTNSAANTSHMNNGQNNDQKETNNESDNGWNNCGGSGGNNNRGWKGRDGDDEKKRENDKNMDKYDDHIKDKDEEDDDDDDDELVPINNTRFKPAPFMLLSRHNRSKSVNSAFNRCNKSSAMRTDYAQYGYTPDSRYRAQGFISISKELTEEKIPDNIKEHIQNVYDYMDKATGIALLDGHILHIENCKILNYGFHSNRRSSIYGNTYAYGEEFFLVADENKNSNYKVPYVMRDVLYTKKQICDTFCVKEHDLPRSFVDLNKNNMKKIMETLSDALQDLTFYENVFPNYNWNKLPIFHGTKGKKDYNKRRVTFSLTKHEFLSSIKAFVCGKRSKLIPMVMFIGNKYRVEFLHVVNIEKDHINIDIGISYAFDNGRVEPTGIHLDKDCIIRQHQLIVPNHRCYCLDQFQCDIDDLHIGNCDDDKNRVKALRSENFSLKRKIHEQDQKMDEQSQEITKLRLQNVKLMQHSISYTQSCPVATLPSVPPSPSMTHTPVSVRTSIRSVPPIIVQSRSPMSPTACLFSPHPTRTSVSPSLITNITPSKSVPETYYTPSSTTFSQVSVGFTPVLNNNTSSVSYSFRSNVSTRHRKSSNLLMTPTSSSNAPRSRGGRKRSQTISMHERRKPTLKDRMKPMTPNTSYSGSLSLNVNVEAHDGYQASNKNRKSNPKSSQSNYNY